MMSSDCAAYTQHYCVGVRTIILCVHYTYCMYRTLWMGTSDHSALDRKLGGSVKCGMPVNQGLLV